MEENDNRGRFIKAETIDKQPIGKNYLLMIGINSYEHIKKLNYAVSDTLAVKDLLTKRYHFETKMPLGIKPTSHLIDIQ